MIIHLSYVGAAMKKTHIYGFNEEVLHSLHCHYIASILTPRTPVSIDIRFTV